MGMNLISCDGCGVVIDLEKRPEVDMFDASGARIDAKIIWTGSDYVAAFDCPVCNHKLQRYGHD